MEWIILVVLVPAVIVPVVLLLGFSGCAAIVGIETVTVKPLPPGPPTPAPAPATWKPRTQYTHDLTTGSTEPLTDCCVAQVMPATSWGPVTGIRITVRAGSSDLEITQASVSKQGSGPGVLPWDSGSTITKFVDADSKAVPKAESLTVKANQTGRLESPGVPADGRWLVVFRIQSGDGRWLQNPSTNAYDAYIKHGAPVTDVMAQKRDWLSTLSTLNPRGKSLFLIEMVEVLSP